MVPLIVIVGNEFPDGFRVLHDGGLRAILAGQDDELAAVLVYAEACGRCHLVRGVLNLLRIRRIRCLVSQDAIQSDVRGITACCSVGLMLP